MDMKIDMDISEAPIDAAKEYEAYMSSHFDFEYADITPAALSDGPKEFKLFNAITQVSLSNPYSYVVDNSRVYDYTEYY